MTPATTLASQRRRRRRLLRLAISGAATVLVVVVLLFNPYAQYERTHDLPNSYWALFNGAYTFTPDAGPPGPGLLDRRPDTIVEQYVRQYIAEFGSYPCHGVVGGYTAAHLPDTTCPPPVAQVEVTQTTVGKLDLAPEGHHGDPVAYVSLLVRYTDGTTADRTITMFPKESTFYFLSWVHLNCWSSGETSAFYSIPDRQVPYGVSYFYPAGDAPRGCKR